MVTLLALLDGSRLKDKGGYQNDCGVYSQADLLTVFIRQNCPWQYNHPYNGRLTALLTKFQREDLGKGIKGRSSVGILPTDLDGLVPFYQAWAITLNKTPDIHSHLYDLLTSDAFDINDKENMIRKLDRLKTFSAETDKYLDLFEHDLSVKQINQQKENFINLVSTVLVRLKDNKNTIIENASVDDIILKTYEQFGAHGIKNNETTPCPKSLFEIKTPPISEMRSQNIINYRINWDKSLVIKGLPKTNVYGIDNIWKETVENLLSSYASKTLLESIEWTETTINNEIEWLKTLPSLLEGNSKILLVGGWRLAKFIESFRWDDGLQEAKGELNYSYREGMQNSYLGDFGLIETHRVFAGKEEKAFLIEKDCLKSIDLYKLTDDSYIEITHSKANEEEKVLLELTLDVDVQIQSSQGFQFKKV